MHNNYHILNGDCLKSQFPRKQIQGDLIVARECLIDGKLEGDSLEDFWKTRKTFMQQEYGETELSYQEKVISEFQKIIDIPNQAVVNLWFEDDLFCMSNFWFSLSLVGQEIPVYIVKPKPNDWNGFGAMSPSELYQAYLDKSLLSSEERTLMAACWKAFKNHDLKQLKDLSKNDSPNFPQLAEVCQAHIDRFPKAGALSRPASMLWAIISEQKNKDFKSIFPIFNQQAGIYGFGDLQVKRIYDQIIQKFDSSKQIDIE